MNGMNSPKVNEQELMMQLLQAQNKGVTNGKTRMQGG
jgi:hypothetical protein